MQIVLPEVQKVVAKDEEQSQSPQESQSPSLEELNLQQISLMERGKLKNIDKPIEHQSVSTNKESIEIILPAEDECLVIQKRNNISLDQLKQVNRQLMSKTSCYSYFWNLWNRLDLKQLLSSFQFLVKSENWYVNRFQYEKPLEIFLNIFSGTIEEMPYGDKIYPGFQALIKKMQQMTEIRGNKSFRIDEKSADLLYKHFLDEIRSRVRKEGAYYIKDQTKNTKVPLSDFIAEGTVLNSHAWASIFFKASVYRKNEQQRQQGDPEIIRQRQKKMLIKQQIINNGVSIYAADNHICCAQFFYFNHKIYDQIITQCPVITQRNFKPLLDVNSNQLHQTILDICGLLNSGGGVILFNAFKNYLQIWPKGQTILQSQYSQARSRIEKELKFISPKVQMDKEVFVNFVPVCRNPITNPTSQKVTQKQYIQGLYIMRVIVKPSEDNSEYFYYYSMKEGEQFETAIVEKNKRRNIGKVELYKLMRKKFNNYYVPEDEYQDQQQKSMLKRAYSWFTYHSTCLKPDRGLVLFQKAENEASLSDEELERRFKYLTLIVTTKNYFGEVKERLQSKGIDCQLAVKYSQYRFKSSHNSAALYHNLRFDHLLSEVAYKKQFEFNGRYILTIAVTKYIRLTNRNKSNIMAECDFATLQRWLHAEHPNEKLIMWKYEESRDEYQFYMETGSKSSTLFMYYVMNHYNEKCTFKNPKDFHCLNEAEKKERFTQFYPRLKNA